VSDVPAPDPAPKGEFREAKPNPAFPPQITALIRFYVAAKGEVLEPCPLCGKRSRGRWTMLCPFTAHEFGAFAITAGVAFTPLTLVCSAHPIMPTKPILEAL
jgi:hypothetical protein